MTRGGTVVRSCAVVATLALAAVIPGDLAGAAPACPDALQRAAGSDVCVDSGRKAAAVVEAIRSLQDQYSLQAVMFGVWDGATSR